MILLEGPKDQLQPKESKFVCAGGVKYTRALPSPEATPQGCTARPPTSNYWGRLRHASLMSLPPGDPKSVRSPDSSSMH
eukprot:1348576-Amorphochlora_amoeboformis.AAC.3